MKKSQSRILVIDASIARASGGKGAVHPKAADTRNFLVTVLQICHKAVMTPAVRDEWDKHQSNFARKWRSSMVAKKKLLLVDVPENDEIRNQVTSANIGQKQKNAMLKDCHLLEAAIANDFRVISLDDTVQELFKNELNFPEVNNVLWVNPTVEAQQILNWLCHGAKDCSEYKLESTDV